jgi:serine/threonine protein kinase
MLILGTRCLVRKSVISTGSSRSECSSEVMFRIVEDPMPPLPEKCDALLEDFLTRCFHKSPALRPSAEELFEHPWLKKNWSAFKVLFCPYHNL